MDNQKCKPKVYIKSAFILALASLIIKSALYIFAFDVDPGYFAVSFFSRFSDALTVISCIWFLTVFIFIPKGSIKETAERNISLLEKICNLLCSAAFIAHSFLYSIPQFASNKNGIYLVIAISGIVSAIYFLLFVTKLAGTTLHSSLGLAIVAFGFLILIATYFDNYLMLNSPIKASIQFSLMFYTLFAISEIKNTVTAKITEKNELSSPRSFLAFGLICLIISASSSLPVIIAYFVGDYTDIYYMFHAIVCLVLMLRVAAVLAGSFLKNDAAEATVEVSADEIKEKVKEAETETKENPTEGEKNESEEENGTE